MAWTKPVFYLSLLFVAVVFFVGIAKVGTDLINTDRIEFNDQSVDYLNQIKGTSSDSGFEAIADTDSAESVGTGILDSEDNKSVSDNNDFLSTLYIQKERASAPIKVFQLIYNIPSSILLGLSLPIDEFRHITNIFSYFLVIALIILAWTKLVRSV